MWRSTHRDRSSELLEGSEEGAGGPGFAPQLCGGEVTMARATRVAFFLGVASFVSACGRNAETEMLARGDPANPGATSPSSPSPSPSPSSSSAGGAGVDGGSGGNGNSGSVANDLISENDVAYLGSYDDVDGTGWGQGLTH